MFKIEVVVGNPKHEEIETPPVEALGQSQKKSLNYIDSSDSQEALYNTWCDKQLKRSKK